MSEIEAAIKRHKKRAYNIYEEEKDDRKISQIFSKILKKIDKYDLQQIHESSFLW